MHAKLSTEQKSCQNDSCHSPDEEKIQLSAVTADIVLNNDNLICKFSLYLAISMHDHEVILGHRDSVFNR